MSTGNFMGSTGQLATPATSAGLEAGPRYDLRPLSTGEVLDRTFQIYRTRFVLFAGLSMLPAAVNTLLNAARLVLAAHPGGDRIYRTHFLGAGLYSAQGLSAVLSILAGLIAILLWGITQAATTWAVSAVYLGEPASIKAAYKVAFQHWFRYTLVVLRQAWAAMWLPLCFLMSAVMIPIWTKKHGGGLGWLVGILFGLVFLSMIYAAWAYIRVSLAVPAAVVESLKVRASVRRSAQLLASRKVRIFLLLLLIYALYMVMVAIESPALILMVRSRGTAGFVAQAIYLGINFFAATLIGPVGAIGVCLFYFDERVRREGFDIEWMMRKLAPEDAAAETSAPSIPSQENSAEPA